MNIRNRVKSLSSVASRDEWLLPNIETIDLSFRVGESMLAEWVIGYDPAAVLRELAQNEYDAGGSWLQVSFGKDVLEVTGNGFPIDKNGWRRLSVMLGTGHVHGSEDEVAAKTNGIGSKNFGLRSLFLFGDQIYVRSNGRQMVLDLARGTPRDPIPDVSSQGTRGIQIHVPYRASESGSFRAFDLDAEPVMLDGLAKNIASTLIKLADHGKRKSLREVIVTSDRHSRRISWKQSVQKLPANRRGVTLLHRRVSVMDNHSDRFAIEELEWQRALPIPGHFSNQRIPGYFPERGDRVRLGLSIQTERRRLPKQNAGGILFYPIGVRGSFTGNAISINGPFEMDYDRSQVITPENSQFNGWLLDRAAELTVELLGVEWFSCFGARAYAVAGQLSESTLPRYVEAVRERLKSANCWPTNHTTGRVTNRPGLAAAHDLHIPDAPQLNVFLEEQECLHSGLRKNAVIRKLAQECGVKSFTLNSLVRLRCAGESSDHLTTELDSWESKLHFIPFPDSWRDLHRQIQFADALDALSPYLSRHNKNDLKQAQTTMTADGTLEALEGLYHVPDEIGDSCPLPASSRLHQDLCGKTALRKLCNPFNAVQWVREVAERSAENRATDEERRALYRYLISIDGRLPSRVRAVVSKSPVLLDHTDGWVAPRSITSRKTKGARLFGPILHLPKKEYVANRALARLLSFKERVTSDDAVQFAELVASNPEMAERFERALNRHSHLLTRRTVERIRSIRCLRSNDEKMQAPEDLYLETPKIRACVGPAGPFPVGRMTALYKRIGCRTHPKPNDILTYLEALRVERQPPPQPHILYPELVRALERNGSAPDSRSDEPILWIVDRFATPNETLICGRRTSLFEGALPYVTGLKTETKKAYLALVSCQVSIDG